MFHRVSCLHKRSKGCKEFSALPRLVSNCKRSPLFLRNVAATKTGHTDADRNPTADIWFSKRLMWHFSRQASRVGRSAGTNPALLPRPPPGPGNMGPTYFPFCINRHLLINKYNCINYTTPDISILRLLNHLLGLYRPLQNLFILNISEKEYMIYFKSGKNSRLNWKENVWMCEKWRNWEKNGTRNEFVQMEKESSIVMETRRKQVTNRTVIYCWNIIEINNSRYD